jgi:hypothetical protein
MYLAFDGGPFGTNHQHEDALSFWLSAYGRSFIVDPGRHLYDESAYSYYPYLKTTRAHSTILIDGLARTPARDRIAGAPSAPLPILWNPEADGGVTVEAIYDVGYGPQNLAVTHRRRIRFIPKPGCWIIDDTVAGEGEHAIESRFQFAPAKLKVDGWAVTSTFDDANLLLSASDAQWQNLSIECGQENPRAGWYSDGYNKIEPAPAVVLRTRTKLPFHAKTMLFPYRGGGKDALANAMASVRSLRLQ